MEMSQKELVKSLTSLIDETLEEIEVIKKSKFAASEIKIEGPGDTKMGGKPTNGELDAKKKEDEDEDEDKKKEMEDAKKGENEKADPDAGKFAQAPTVSKGENEKADPDAGKFAQAPTVSKKEEDKDEDEDEDKKKEMKDMKKSISRSEDLMKSYVDEKFSTLEERLSKLASAIESLANAPVGRRGVPAGVQALAKSADEGEALTKSTVTSKLWDLKKSGTPVDSSDIFTAETCKSYGELKQIADKYGVK
jgi:hypothetical protein